MNTEAEQESGQFDVAKLALAVIMVVFGIGGFYYYADQSLLLRVVGLLVALSVSVGWFMQLSWVNHFGILLKGRKLSLKRSFGQLKKKLCKQH